VAPQPDSALRGCPPHVAPGAAVPANSADAIKADESPAAQEAETKEEEDNGDDDDEEESIGEKICNFCGLPYTYMFMFTMPDCKYEEPSDEEADEQIKELSEELNSADAERKAEIEAELDSLGKQKALRGQIEEAEEAEDDDKAKELRQELFALYDPLTCGQKYYVVTFVISLVWITILSYFMVTLMEKIGCVWGISSFIMGTTFLAMGTSVPDALGSISVAKDGEGDMAVSNAIGSNIFDICLGLGLPWFIATLIDGEGRGIETSSESFGASIGFLFVVVIVLILILGNSKHPDTGRRFVITPTVGIVLLCCYALFVIFEIVWSVTDLPE